MPTGTPSLFGYPSSQGQQTTNLFGTPSTTPFGLPPAQPQQTIPANSAIVAVNQIAATVHSASPTCIFRHIFYNVVDPSEVKKYGRPPNIDDLTWQTANRNNPDPTRMTPVIATGFGDLKTRIEEQDKYVIVHNNTIQSIENNIHSIEQALQLNMKHKIDEIKRKHIYLSHKLIVIMKKNRNFEKSQCSYYT